MKFLTLMSRVVLLILFVSLLNRVILHIEIHCWYVELSFEFVFSVKSVCPPYRVFVFVRSVYACISFFTLRYFDSSAQFVFPLFVQLDYFFFGLLRAVVVFQYFWFFSDGRVLQVCNRFEIVEKAFESLFVVKDSGYCSLC